MLYEVLRYLRNFFPGFQWFVNDCEIKDGVIELSGLNVGQYFMIEGSRLNDGIWRYKVDSLKDETFDGWITELRIPDSLISLASEIETWQAENSKAVESPYQSESFGGYSYTKASGNGGKSFGWQDAFYSRLKVYKKL